MNFIQSKTVRDAAAMLDCLSNPQIGDPFIIPKPVESYATLARKTPAKLRIAVVLTEMFGVKVDPEVARAVETTGRILAGMGHAVETAETDVGGLDTLRALNELFFFAFDARLESYARRSGQKIGPDMLEPMILSIYEWSKGITPARFMMALGVINTARRRMARIYASHDIMLSPTTSRVAEPWGNYHLSKPGVNAANIVDSLFAIPCQFTVPHNIMGTPAISLPLAMHSTGVPIGVQLAGRPADEHLLLQLATALEQAMPWASRMPPLHVSTMA
jgi:amidase